MNEEFITIAEAEALTGRTDLDLMRIIKEYLRSSGLPLESIMKKEQRGKGLLYVINKKTLFDQLNSGKSQKEEFPSIEDEVVNVPQEIIRVKDVMIEMLQKIIETKDKQMEDLSKKIDQLIERDRETNILFKGLQERIFLIEDSKQTKPDQKQTRQ